MANYGDEASIYEDSIYEDSIYGDANYEEELSAEQEASDDAVAVAHYYHQAVRSFSSSVSVACPPSQEENMDPTDEDQEIVETTEEDEAHEDTIAYHDAMKDISIASTHDGSIHDGSIHDGSTHDGSTHNGHDSSNSYGPNSTNSYGPNSTNSYGPNSSNSFDSYDEYGRAKRHINFAAPVNLFDGIDGQDDSETGFRRESHVSQGFVITGDATSFAKAKNSRVLVTGGAGFIGSHLVKRLLLLGNSVIVVDNLVTGSLSNLEELLASPRLMIVNHDILDPLPKHLVVDEIYHLACPSSPFFWQTNLINTFSIIVDGTRNVLEFAQRIGAKVLHASTADIYGDSVAGMEMQNESYKGSVDCFTARASHDEAKRAAEALCFAYQSERRAKLRIARIGNVYGPKMGICDGTMISSFTCAFIENVKVVVTEEDEADEATRTILYVDDCINGLIKLMNSSYNIPINIAGDDIFSVKELHSRLQTLVANPSNALPWKVVSFEPFQGTRRPGNLAAFVHLRWHPEVKAHEGLEATVRYFKEVMQKKAQAKAKDSEARLQANRERDEYMKRQKGLKLKGDADIPLVPLSTLCIGGGESQRYKKADFPSTNNLRKP